MKKERLLQLWFLKLTNKLTPEEEQELQQWCEESPHHEDLMLRALNPHRIKKSLEAEPLFDESKAWEHFTSQKAYINSKKKASVWSMSIRRYVAVSTILIVLTATCYWGFHNKVESDCAPQTKIPQIYAACEGVTLSYQGKTQKIDAVQYNVGDTTIITHEPVNNQEKQESPSLTINVAKGNSFKLILDDSTEVLLNSCSQIIFPRHFHGNRREITLSYGEAFFKVTHHPTKPFIIHTMSSSIQVLGTTFNINAYTNEHQVATTLIEGSVAFHSKNNEKFILKPGMQSCMDTTTGETSIEQVDTSIYTAWLDGEFVFQSIDLPGIMRQMERWYDIEVDYQDCNINKYHFKGTFNKELSLQQVLEILSDATGLRFIIDGKLIKIMQ